MSFLGSTKPIARKQHRCEECWRVIGIGERYHRNEFIDDNGIATWKACAQCSSLGHDLFQIGIYGEDPYSGCPCYPTLQDVDWREVPTDDVWAARVAGWRAQWTALDGSLIAYPVAAGVGVQPEQKEN